MLIHFIASTDHIKDSMPYFRRIAKIVADKGHELSRDWIESSYDLATRSDELDWQSLYKENIEALARSDIFIADVTNKGFAVGYQAALSLQQKKPTLLLFKDKEVDKTFMSGLDNTLLSLKTYSTEADLDGIVSHFIEENTIETKDMRFNFFIDRAIYNYLRWASLKTGKTKAEVLRELVQREIENKDY
jgi:nucleoside 2-deoxyribosyltransferase